MSKEDEIGIPSLEKTETLESAIAEIKRRNTERKIWDLYPDDGPLRRELYQPHTKFFKAGKTKRERCVIAANRIGKSYGIGGYETALHLCGLYPSWWEGRTFDSAVNWWACGDTGQTVRDIAQEILLGPPSAWGTGLIPGELITDIKKKAGNVPDAVEQVLVKHYSGGTSRLVFKSYDQKRKSFQGTGQHGIWLDEECPMDVYGECLLRTMTTGGVILLTFTPLMGLTEVVLNFMPNGKMPDNDNTSKFIVNATWDDAPHLSEEQKQEIIEGTPPYLRDARAKGIPQLGAGAIYPILEEDVVIPDFELPPWYPRAYALDVGWNCTAALWGAWDRESDIIYLYSCHKQGHAEPSTHVQSIVSRGDWINGVIDPASAGRSQLDGKRLIDEYTAEFGLNLSYANNAIEAGIFAVWERLVSGRLKVFKSLVQWFNEFRIYRRAESGRVAPDQDDHLMDCTRYLVMSGLQVARVMPYHDEENYFNKHRESAGIKKREGYFGIY